MIAQHDCDHYDLREITRLPTDSFDLSAQVPSPLDRDWLGVNNPSSESEARSELKTSPATTGYRTIIDYGANVMQD